MGICPDKTREWHMQFRQGIGWKACYDEERELYTARRSWRGDYSLYEIDEDIFRRLGEIDKTGEDPDDLIMMGRLLYKTEDSPIGPPTDTVIDDNFASLVTWESIPSSGHVVSKELTDLVVGLFGNEKTRQHRKMQEESKEPEE